MARGARNKQRKAARRVRREIFEPKVIAQQDAITPDLEQCRENIRQRDEAVKQKIQEAEANKEMGEQDATKVIDEKTKKNKDGNYASWLTGKEVKKLKKINNKKKTQSKNKKKQIEKRLKALSNTESGRKAIEALKQKKLDQATMAKKSEMETM